MLTIIPSQKMFVSVLYTTDTIHEPDLKHIILFLIFVTVIYMLFISNFMLKSFK